MTGKLTLNARRMMGISMRESAHGAFGGYLLNALKELRYDKMPSEFQCVYTVPPSLCNEQGPVALKSKPYMPTSAILALFDELSAHMMIGYDKNYRPGTSVILDTELLKPVCLNDEVVVATHVDKIGNFMGFCTMELYNKDCSILLARGKQIKFMPVGFFFDFISRPYIFPFFYQYYEKIHGRRYVTSIDHLLPDHKPHTTKTIHTPKPTNDAIGAMYSALSIEKISDSNQFATLQGHAENSGYYTVPPHPKLVNPLGMYHGGAIAAALEDTCRAYKREVFASTMQIEPIIQSMEIRYLSAMKVDYSYS
jgi:acyl-coenzyme A thioesterase PaaI-like protein